jgi:2',3'-cyclic-nucleotide 2'-phosphodiesterase (5'-nucleotidase family)
MRRTARLLLAALAAVGLTALIAAADPATPASKPASRATVTISIIGTSDLHGHLEMLPRLGGYLANLRRARAADHGGVLLLDAGDMFQGTLESNLGEGAAVIAAYGALGYDAAALGNHELDFGPVGEAATPRGPADDPRGAIKARAAEARFPLLAANLLDAATHRPVGWPNLRPSALLRVGGVAVGVIGVTTAATPFTTIAANFRGLEVAPLAATIAAEARALRAAGATVVVVAAHAGGSCARFDDPDDTSSCQADGEIFPGARALPAGAVDVIVAGHAHDGIAHRVAGIAIIESYAEGRAFGRIDLTVDRASGRPSAAHIWPPRPLCASAALCAAERYEGAQVVPDAAVSAAIAPAFARARARRQQPLGVTITSPIERRYKEESALGNLFTDLMRAAHPEADVAITNGGGLRADLPAGPLTYGSLFEAIPFDNRFATLHLRGDELQRLIAHNLTSGGGILSLSGVRAAARCDAHGTLQVTLSREPGGRPVDAGERLIVITSDFLASGGNSLFPPGATSDARIDEVGPPIRDAMAAQLKARGGRLDGHDPRLLDASHARITYPAPRPVNCGPTAGGPRTD